MEKTESTAVLEAVRDLWRLCTPVQEIAEQLHVQQATVVHIIEHGCLPQLNDQPHWKK